MVDSNKNFALCRFGLSTDKPPLTTVHIVRLECKAISIGIRLKRIVSFGDASRSHWVENESAFVTISMQFQMVLDTIVNETAEYARQNGQKEDQPNPPKTNGNDKKK